MGETTGISWSDATTTKWCSGCKTRHPVACFGHDRSRPDGLDATCREARNRRARSKYTPKPGLRYGPLPHPPRDGDREQARQRINVLVRTGHLAHPNTLPCVDCGHEWAEDERRHEYDHYEGYAPDKHLVVEVVCTTCHRARTQIEQTRDERGRYSRRGVVTGG